MQLNKLYKAINLALDINTDDQVRIFNLGGQYISRSLATRFWRNPENKKRFKSISAPYMLTYLRGLRRGLHGSPASEVDTIMKRLNVYQDARHSDAAKDLKLTEEDLEFWIQYAMVMHRGDIRGKL